MTSFSHLHTVLPDHINLNDPTRSNTNRLERNVVEDTCRTITQPLDLTLIDHSIDANFDDFADPMGGEP